MVIYLCLFVCILGGVLYLVLLPPPTGAKVAELGRLAFVVGLLVFLLLVTGSRSISLGH
jgi:hypothetical protein